MDAASGAVMRSRVASRADEMSHPRRTPLRMLRDDGAAQLVKALLYYCNLRDRGEYESPVCLGVFEDKKTFLELGFEFTHFGVTGVVAAQS